MLVELLGGENCPVIQDLRQNAHLLIIWENILNDYDNTKRRKIKRQ